MSYKLGRLAPHPEETHPRVHFNRHIAGPAPIPSKIDWYSKVTSFPMLLNDQLGDCTAAGFWHLVQSWSASVAKSFTPTNQEALDLYEPTGGYVPGNPSTDQGANEQNVLAYLAIDGCDGHKVDAFAQVDPHNQTEVLTALNAFGGLYIGIMCPDSMQQQFAAAQPGQMPVIDVVPGAQIEGGHCIVVVGWDGENYICVTWGALVKVTPAFWNKYVEEVWAVISADFFNADGNDPAGVNLQSLVAEFNEIGLAAYKPVYTPPADDGAPENFFQKFIDWIRSLLF